MELRDHSRFASVVARGAGIAAIGASAASAALLGIAEYTVHRITSPKDRRHYQYVLYTPLEAGLPWQEVSIPGSRGPLDAWLIPNPNPAAPVIIPLSGHGGNRGDLLGITKQLWKAGFTCLLFDYQSVANTRRAESTLGDRETADTLQVIDWVAETYPGAGIGLLGYSMGGAVAIMAAAEDRCVGAVVTDSAYASQRSLIAYLLRRRLGILTTPVLNMTDSLFARRLGYHLGDLDPVRRIGELSPRPVLIIYGTADAVVPVSQAHELYQAAGEPKQLWIIEGVPHCSAYFADRIGYSQRVAAFFTQSLLSESIHSGIAANQADLRNIEPLPDPTAHLYSDAPSAEAPQ